MGLIGGGAGFPFGINCRYYVVVSRAVFDEIIHATGTGDGYGVNLLAVIARGILLCGVLLFAPVHAVTHGLAFQVDGGSTRIPRESYLVMPSYLR
jgi:hypothetical protein